MESWHPMAAESILAISLYCCATFLAKKKFPQLYYKYNTGSPWSPSTTGTNNSISKQCSYKVKSHVTTPTCDSPQLKACLLSESPPGVKYDSPWLTCNSPLTIPLILLVGSRQWKLQIAIMWQWDALTVTSMSNGHKSPHSAALTSNGWWKRPNSRLLLLISWI